MKKCKTKNCKEEVATPKNTKCIDCMFDDYCDDYNTID